MLHNDLVKVPRAPNAYPGALCEGEHAGDFRCAPRRESVLTHSVCDSPCALNVPASASACPSSPASSLPQATPQCFGFTKLRSNK